MDLNKPKHNVIKHTIYALEGLVDITKTETSFKWHLFIFSTMGAVAWLLPIEFAYSAILFISLFLPMIAEVANSAIERVVDLVTYDYHILAKKAKDVGATLVFLSFFVTVLIWVFVLLIAYKMV